MYNPRNEQRLLQELDQYRHIQTQLEAYRDASEAVVCLLLDIEDLKSSCASDAVAPATTPDAVAPPLQQKAQEAISKLKKLQHSLNARTMRLQQQLELLGQSINKLMQYGLE